MASITQSYNGMKDLLESTSFYPRVDRSSSKTSIYPSSLAQSNLILGTLSIPLYSEFWVHSRVDMPVSRHAYLCALVYVLNLQTSIL